MRNRIVVLLSLSLLLAVFSCKNSLNVLAPYQDVTVVYGLLDQNDSIHYIRINKAYQTAGNAYTAAAQYDSTNYPVGTLNVQLQDYSSGNTITLDTTTSIPVNPGIFPYPKQVLYYTAQKLNHNDQYNLTITNVKTKKIITGSTNLLPDVFLYLNVYSYFLTTDPINLTSTAQHPDVISWTTNNQAMIYQLTMQFYYNEIDSVHKDTITKYVNWVFPQQTSPTLESGYTMFQTIIGQEFTKLLKVEIPPAPPFTKRVPLYMLVMFSTGSSGLNVYLLLSQPSLDVNQEKPFYTDLKNGIGIFTARHAQEVKKPISIGTLDSLMSGSTDQGLNFKSY